MALLIIRITGLAHLSKGRVYGKPIAELQSITCHMGIMESHSTGTGKRAPYDQYGLLTRK